MESPISDTSNFDEYEAYLQDAELFLRSGPIHVYNKPISKLVHSQFKSLLKAFKYQEAEDFFINSADLLPENLGRLLSIISIIKINENLELEIQIVCEEMKNTKLGYVRQGKISDIKSEPYRDSLLKSYHYALEQGKAIAQTNVLDFYDRKMCHERILVPILPEDRSQKEKYKLLVCSARSNDLQNTMNIDAKFYTTLD